MVDPPAEIAVLAGLEEAVAEPPGHPSPLAPHPVPDRLSPRESAEERDEPTDRPTDD
jgi:hypothetical protein